MITTHCMQSWAVGTFLACGLTASLAVGAARAQDGGVGSLHGMLILNEDDSHFFGSRRPEDMTRAGLEAFVDQYAGSAVTHLFLCPNAMCASFRSQHA